jgi:hypothetical protein
VLALIQHLQETGMRIREGTADAAAKRKAWEEAQNVFNEQAKSDGVNYEWSLEQIKALYNTKRTKFQEWSKKAAAHKSGADNFWVVGEGKNKKPYFYDAFHRLLGERAATAPPTELEVGGSGAVVKKSKVRVRSGSRARCLTHARGTQGKAAAAGVGGEARLLGGEGADGDDGDDVLFVGDSPLPTAPIRNTTGEGEGEEADADRQARRKAKAVKRAQEAGKAKDKAETLKKEEKRRRRAEKEEDAQLNANAMATAFGPVFADLSKTIKHAAASLAAPGGKRKSEGGSTRKSRRGQEEEDEEEDEDTE